MLMIILKIGHIEHHSVVVSIPDSYSGGHRFRSQLPDHLYQL